jgi:hypothetical protein
MRIARPQHRGDELVGVAVEHQQRVIPMLPEIAVVGGAFRGSLRRIVGAIEVPGDAGWGTGPLAFLQIDGAERVRQPVAGAPVAGVVQPGQRRLAGHVGPVCGRPTAD